MEPSESSVDPQNVTHYTNLWYGISYDSDNQDFLEKVSSKDKRYKALFCDREYSDGKFTYFKTLNSDITSSRTMIVVEEFTTENQIEDVHDGFINFQPSDLIRMEEEGEKAVNFITDLYDALVQTIRSQKDKKKVKEMLADIKVGWCVANCSWDENSDSDESSDDGKNTDDKK